jgi:hypothetical protein
MINKLLSFIGKFFTSKTEEVEILDGIYFHEDFFRQVEFLPKENYNFLKNENLKIREFSDEHSDGNGLFTDIFVREEEVSTSIADRKIELTDFELTLNILELQRISNVYTGYSNYKERCDDMFAYQFDSAQIFVVIDEKYVKDLFVTGFRFFEDETIKNKLEEVLFEIGAKYRLILNDWDLTEVVDLSDKIEIRKYLNEQL